MTIRRRDGRRATFDFPPVGRLPGSMTLDGAYGPPPDLAPAPAAAPVPAPITVLAA